MSDVLLDLPDSLQHQLEERALKRGVSLQEIIVDSLVHAMAVPDVAEQKAVFEELLSRYPLDESEAALREILAVRK
ncbi:MAG TPA: hypothetical protein VEW48_28635 [Thermoanaerobaculia bacterium]|nr:hypothetical protein [Thermoanaerobaculia bacterium]